MCTSGNMYTCQRPKHYTQDGPGLASHQKFCPKATMTAVVGLSVYLIKSADEPRNGASPPRWRNWMTDRLTDWLTDWLTWKLTVRRTPAAVLLWLWLRSRVMASDSPFRLPENVIEGQNPITKFNYIQKQAIGPKRGSTSKRTDRRRKDRRTDWADWSIDWVF
jgi:hypothetical protein